jgi:hypothetical protein
LSIHRRKLKQIEEEEEEEEEEDATDTVCCRLKRID